MAPPSNTRRPILQSDGTEKDSVGFDHEEGLLFGDLDLAAATGLLASRYKILS